MTIACAAPDAAAGVALRFATYADCQARALGENGFQALIGSPILTGLTSGLVTIFVALIGYRLILSQPLTLGDGVTRMARLGMVLALTTAWPAFQILVFNVVTDGPAELAATVLPSTGLPDQSVEQRVQLAYDTMRLGVVDPAASARDGASLDPRSSSRAAYGQLPQTASIFVLSTLGVSGALRIAVGFLLAIAPLAMLGLLFDATLGLFSGWVRALAGAALGSLASVIVTALDLTMIEGELGQQQAYSQGGVSAVVDPQALTTLTLLFAFVMLVVVILAVKMAGAFTLRWKLPEGLGRSETARSSASVAFQDHQQPAGQYRVGMTMGRSRAAALADDFQAASARDTGIATMAGQGRASQTPQRHTLVAEGLIQSGNRNLARSGQRAGLGRASRRSSARDRAS